MVSILAFVTLCAIIFMCCHIMATDYNDLKFGAMAFFAAGILELSSKANVTVDKFGNCRDLSFHLMLLFVLIVTYAFRRIRDKEEKKDD